METCWVRFTFFILTSRCIETREQKGMETFETPRPAIVYYCCIETREQKGMETSSISRDRMSFPVLH